MAFPKVDRPDGMEIPTGPTGILDSNRAGVDLGGERTPLPSPGLQSPATPMVPGGKGR